MPGLAHTLIFFGFLAIQPHSLELMIRGVCPAFELGRWIPGIYGIYLFLADILAAFVLVGFAYAIYRRTLQRPSYLTMGKDAKHLRGRVEGIAEHRLVPAVAALVGARELDLVAVPHVELELRPDRRPAGAWRAASGCGGPQPEGKSGAM